MYKGEEPDTTGNIRLRLATADSSGPPLVAHLSAMVVKHGALEMSNGLAVESEFMLLLSLLLFRG